jgi:hypothetical protein
VPCWLFAFRIHICHPPETLFGPLERRTSSAVSSWDSGPAKSRPPAATLFTEIADYFHDDLCKCLFSC